ncbi:MAG: hypothetical protein V1779_06725 [bacterium]
MNDNSKTERVLSQQESMKFSGKVTASISHEIKNVLAIINENAGLLQDISGMIEEGFVLSPQRLSAIALKIENQIARANDIISRLNRFAHSVDEEILEFDIYEVIDYMTKIFDRIGKLRGLKVDLIKPGELIRIKTNLFTFQYLIWHCLDFASKNINKETILGISINFENNFYYIIFNFSEELFDKESFETFIENEKVILDTLAGKLLPGIDDKEFRLAISI